MKKSSATGGGEEKVVKYIIVEGHDVNFFADREAAESYIEACDVEAGAYVGYHADGRLLNIVSCRPSSEISLAEERATHEDELEKVVREFLAARHQPLEGLQLDDMLRICATYMGR